tara:strand:+ start:2917 stop:4092 length:1176 start_codon:yes stop_codon:yes gene_type:complete
MTSLSKKNLVIVGSTGFVGRRFCQYLLDQKYYEKCNLIFSARNIQKLNQIFPKKDNDPRYITKTMDTLDPTHIGGVLREAHLVANFAGPFDLYAKKVVEYCAKNGVNYFDITGEFHFIKKMMDRYGDNAKNSGACLIPFSGFDSIPSEVATQKAIKVFRDKFQKDPKKVEHLFQMKGGFNGGTIASAMNFGTKLSLKDILNDHYLSGNQTKMRNLPKPKYFKAQKLWGVPFFMESINSKVVFQGLEQLEENNLFNQLEYSEHMNISKSLGRFSHSLGNHFFNSFNLLLSKKSGQTFLKPFLPSAGQGPSERSVNNGFFKLFSTASDGNDLVSVKLRGLGDPGNKVTVNCILSVLDCFINDDSHPSGFCTPYFAFGENLVENLKRHEIYFEE